MIGKKVHFTCCLIFPPQPRTCMFSFLNNNLVKYGGNEWRLETGCPQSIVPVTRWGIPPIKCYTSWRENEKYSRTCLHRLNDSWNHIACVFILLLVFYFFFSVRPSAVDSSGEEQQSEPRAKTDRYERTPSTYQGYWSGPLLTIATTQAIDNSRVWKIGCLTTTAIDASADLVAMGPVIWRQAQKAKKYININMLCWTYACHGDDFVVDKLWR